MTQRQVLRGIISLQLECRLHHHHDVRIPGRKKPIDRCPLGLPWAWGRRILGETVHHKRSVEMRRAMGRRWGASDNFADRDNRRRSG